MKSCKEFKNISYNNKYEEKLPRCIENIFKLQIITVFFINFYHPVNNNGKCIHVYAILQQNNISFLLTPWSSLHPKFWRLSKFAFFIEWSSNSKTYLCIIQIIYRTTISFTLMFYILSVIYLYSLLDFYHEFVQKNHEWFMNDSKNGSTIHNIWCNITFYKNT